MWQKVLVLVLSEFYLGTMFLTNLWLASFVHYRETHHKKKSHEFTVKNYSLLRLKEEFLSMYPEIYAFPAPIPQHDDSQLLVLHFPKGTTSKKKCINCGKRTINAVKDTHLYSLHCFVQFFECPVVIQ